MNYKDQNYWLILYYKHYIMIYLTRRERFCAAHRMFSRTGQMRITEGIRQMLKSKLAWS